MYRIVERKKLEISPISIPFLPCRVWTLQPTTKISEYCVACLNEQGNLYDIKWAGFTQQVDQKSLSLGQNMLRGFDLKLWFCFSSNL